MHVGRQFRTCAVRMGCCKISSVIDLAVGLSNRASSSASGATVSAVQPCRQCLLSLRHKSACAIKDLAERLKNREEVFLRLRLASLKFPFSIIGVLGDLSNVLRLCELVQSGFWESALEAGREPFEIYKCRKALKMAGSIILERVAAAAADYFYPELVKAEGLRTFEAMDVADMRIVVLAAFTPPCRVARGLARVTSPCDNERSYLARASFC